MTVLRRRFPAVPLLIYPVTVQGNDAACSLVNALKLAEARQDCDLLIVTRGGGSLEDLMAFNDEAVARAIYQTTIPIISAVGHEIDFTIADFVADMRAPTPSAAAELAVPDNQEFLAKLTAQQRRLSLSMMRRTQGLKERHNSLAQRLQRAHPDVRLQQQQQYLDELWLKLHRTTQVSVQRKADTLQILVSQLQAKTPTHRLNQKIERCETLHHRLGKSLDSLLNKKSQRLGSAVGKLQTLSPLGTLSRGYSITRNLKTKRVIDNIDNVAEGDTLETQVTNGVIISTVTTLPKEQ